MTKLSLAKMLRAAVVALALGGTSMTAAPAMAHSPSPHVDFEFRFGTPGFKWHFDSDRHHRRDCMTNKQVRRDLRRDGYRNIRFLDRGGRYVQVIAKQGRRTYLITYDSCRGRIADRDRIRHH